MTRKLSATARFFAIKWSAHLVIIAGVSGLIYGLVFTIPFPLTKFYATVPPVDYAKLTHHAPGGFMAYVVGIVVLFGLYLWAIHLTAPSGNGNNRGVDVFAGDDFASPVGLTTTSTPDALTGDQATAVGSSFVLISSAFLAAISLFSYPLTAIDLFIYAIRTRGWVLYGQNPLATAPEQIYAGDPWLGLAGEWVDAPSPYGPVWELLSLGAFYLSGGGFLPHLLLLKLAVMLAYLGCVWLVFKTIQLLQPEWAIAGTVAFAWNPLVLLESVQNGHNDIVLTFFLLAAVWVHVKWSTSRPRYDGFKAVFMIFLVCLLLALSILVKFVTIMVVPFFLLALAIPQPDWPRRLTVMGLAGVTIALMVVVPMLPFWPGWEQWSVLQTGSQAGRSLLALLILGLRDSLGLNLAFDFSRNLILLILISIYLYFLWQTIAKLRRTGRTSAATTLAISPSFYVLFWYVLLAAPVFHAWYLLWFLPLAPLLLPNRRPLTASIVFSVTALVAIPYFETIRVWYPNLLQNQFIGHLVGIPLLIGPPILALLWPAGPVKNSEV